VDRELLTEVDGLPASSPDKASGMIKRRRAGETLSFSWIDETDRRRTATVILAPGPAD
jgi:hypothetical protein